VDQLECRDVENCPEQFLLQRALNRDEATFNKSSRTLEATPQDFPRGSQAFFDFLIIISFKDTLSIAWLCSVDDGVFCEWSGKKPC
jgi:hypothetical protein